MGTIVTFRAYLDGAGKEESNPVITVAGFCGHTDVCEAIEKDWEQATGGKLFHFTDFNTPYCKLGSDKWTNEERRDFLLKLAAIVNRRDCILISSTIEVGPFNKQLSVSVHPNEIGPAFSGCAYTAIAIAEFHFSVRRGGLNDQLRYIFEKGDREHEIINLFDDLNKKDSEFFGKRGYAFEPKQTTLLQPADFVAGSYRNA
jgi:hypothetical protein